MKRKKTAYRIDQTFQGFTITCYKGHGLAETHRAETLPELFKFLPEALEWTKKGEGRSLQMEAINSKGLRLVLAAIEPADSALHSTTGHTAIKKL